MLATEIAQPTSVILRVAQKSDLAQVKEMYRLVIKEMNANGITIWDEIYPCEFLQEDIEKNQLYLLSAEHDIAAAFSLCESNLGETFMQWHNSYSKALYIDRLAVNVKYARKGFASLALHQAMVLAKNANAGYLRLFVVDCNIPAIKLYQKNDFTQAIGVYQEKIDDSLTLFEYGFERKL